MNPKQNPQKFNISQRLDSMSESKLDHTLAYIRWLGRREYIDHLSQLIVGDDTGSIARRLMWVLSKIISIPVTLMLLLQLSSGSLGIQLDRAIEWAGRDHRSREGRAIRQLLSTGWLLLCTIALTYLGDVDRSLGTIAWFAVYGALGLGYLALGLAFVVGIVRERLEFSTT